MNHNLTERAGRQDGVTGNVGVLKAPKHTLRTKQGLSLIRDRRQKEAGGHTK